MSTKTRDAEPLEGAQLQTVLDRVGGEVLSSIRLRTQRRTRWTRISGALVAGLVLFVSGTLVGGAVFAASPDAGVVFSVHCFASTSQSDPAVTSSYVDTAAADAARSNAAGVCDRQTQFDATQDALVGMIKTLHGTGVQCGTLHVTDGTTWSFQYAADGSLSLMSATPVTPLAANCISKSNVQLPSPPDLPKAVCVVDASQVDVYPLANVTAHALCQTKGLQATTS